jgi:uncharacterized glyoxalase superfamily protein PhnB
MPRLERIAPELPSANLDSALAYYEKKLGFEVALRFPGNQYAIVERDDVAIHLFVAEASNSYSICVHIFASGLDQLFRELQTSGALICQKIERKPWGNREFRVRDEFGNELKFTEPIEEDAA